MRPGCVSVRAVASLRSVSPLLVSCLVLLSQAGCTRAFLQNEGPYALTTLEVVRDDCALLAPEAPPWGGWLTISGEVVRMDFDLLGMQLIGNFLEAGAENNDAFSLDGSVTNASVTVRGGACRVNQVSVHLTGTTQCATQFNGALRVRYEPQPEQPACACQLWVRYRALQKKENGETSAPCDLR